ncbi:MAG TPA: FKBP-type peptidyl-prolyl cis-trans isomerase [Solirubrobacterales bacterium]
MVGDYEAEGPFSAVHGGRGNDLPRFVPPDRPAPKQVLTRDLEVGTGPAAESGDEVSVYYAGANYSASKPNYGGWPPSYPVVFTIGDSLYEDAWEESFVGMRAGGLRQAIIPSRLLEGSSPPPLNYVIKLVALETDPQPE